MEDMLRECGFLRSSKKSKKSVVLKKKIKECQELYRKQKAEIEKINKENNQTRKLINELTKKLKASKLKTITSTSKGAKTKPLLKSVKSTMAATAKKTPIGKRKVKNVASKMKSSSSGLGRSKAGSGAIKKSKSKHKTGKALIKRSKSAKIKAKRSEPQMHVKTPQASL